MSSLRLVLYFLMLFAGFQVGGWLEARGLLGAESGGLLSLNRLYLGLVGLLLGFLLVPRAEAALEGWWLRLQRWLKSLPPEVPVALIVASSAGLLLTVLINNLLSQFEGYTPWYSLLLALVLSGFFSALALANRDAFRIRPPAHPVRPRGGKILDTSVLIDGRIAEVADLGFLEGPLLVPQMVLRELQNFADHPDAQRRARGRRGLEVLERLKDRVGLEVLEAPASDEPVDDQLLTLARQNSAALVTNDSALLQLARIYGVKALSVQALATALRTPYVAGEVVRITITKEGKEAGQGVGYLDDGTMIVVDDALPYRGQEVAVVITQSIQTQVGRLLFGKLERSTTSS
ncbi:putative PIN and TRAM-domain containing protein [Calidithermus terrae]|uniref:Putative PIN and TRAM-domain containing protein n=1 Tax=Calidithermus terrae TaxID=1408545 RepID=A0A399F2G2_9DEIN|nr:TRAM domain-containing protein [Calidithermus terrae]RIH90937.1 putative PIN and TRAM-domain containing protein [Calidithermus terrae]